MAKSKQLGIFWGSKSLFFVETMATTATKFFDVPLGGGREGYIEDGKYVSGDMQLITPIQNALHHQAVATPATINLSLPTTDIIFRTFIIPWMPAGEVKGVVTFEISKYIPFSLEDLSYSFYPMTVSINGAKRIRIIFVAIKKDSLSQYTDVLEKAGLIVNLVEPAPISLIRTLSFKGILPPSQIAAVVEKENDRGRIIVIDQGAPLFVRDFQVRIPDSQPDKSEKALTTVLINELRISLDYFNRQNNQVRVKEIFLISPENSETLASRLKEDLDISVTSITEQLELSSKTKDIISNINAFGTGIFESVYSRATFNLTDKAIKSKGLEGMIPSGPRSFSMKTLIIVVASCLSISVLSFLTPNFMLSARKQSLNAITKKLGAKKDLPIDTIKEENDILSQKTENIKLIRTESDISFFLSTVPKMLPKGTWLNSFSIDYTKGKKRTVNKKSIISPEILMSGYSYSEIPSKQFSQINEFIASLKNKNNFSVFFENIELKAVVSKIIDSYSVKSFSIDCR